MSVGVLSGTHSAFRPGSQPGDPGGLGALQGVGWGVLGLPELAAGWVRIAWGERVCVHCCVHTHVSVCSCTSAPAPVPCGHVGLRLWALRPQVSSPSAAFKSCLFAHTCLSESCEVCVCVASCF